MGGRGVGIRRLGGGYFQLSLPHLCSDGLLKLQSCSVGISGSLSQICEEIDTCEKISPFKFPTKSMHRFSSQICDNPERDCLRECTWI